MSILRASFLVLLVATCAYADVYMHNPRGSNDRNCERNDNRNNGNRLFDSQNNGKGGYACPRAVGGPEVKGNNMYYYVGSQLAIEWTAQHGCGPNSKVHCDMVIQYMCNDANPELRDGTPKDLNDAATDRVPDNEEESKEKRFGLHETFEYYQRCKQRRRNHGLFIADRNVRTDATGTRQNNNGNRNGFECPEERDHYPYWQPTPWKDIAILTSDPSRCEWYQANSNNVKEYGYCDGKREGNGPHVPNFKDECEARGFVWKESSHNLPAPDCGAAQWSRVNQLGNTLNGYPVTYNWTIPDDVHETCVLRLRYNISTGEYPGNTAYETLPYFNHAQNSKIKENQAKFPSPMITEHSLPEEHMKDRPFFVTSKDEMEDAATAFDLREDTTCEGTYQDLLREFKADDAAACKAKCLEFGTACAGFVHVREGENAGMCFFRGGNIKEAAYKGARTGTLANSGKDGCGAGKCPMCGGDCDRDSDCQEGLKCFQRDGLAAVPGCAGGDENNDVKDYDYCVPKDMTVGTDCYARKGYTGTADNSPKHFFALAMNSNQFGRTFQDRSYTFGIKPRPDDIPEGVAIQNLNVRGKRGNIVQAYPAVEYDFVPSALEVDESTYIHFQWEGSDYNPRRGPNNGEGGPPDKKDNDPNQNARADRSNIVETSIMDVNIPTPKHNDIANSMFETKEQAWRMAFLDQTGCKSMTELSKINGERRRQNDIGNCGKLNGQAHPYFDGGLVKMTKPGRFSYMCTRNNNFSNRSHKGYLTVKPEKGEAVANPEFAGLIAGSKTIERFDTFVASSQALDEINARLKARTVGCFQDNRGSRDLAFLAVRPTNNFSPQMCIDACKAKGYKFAGAQNRNECWCDNHFGRQGRLDDHFCAKPCTGEPSLSCGGPSANLVFHVESDAVDDTVKAGTGCFIEYTNNCKRNLKNADWQAKYIGKKVHDIWGRQDKNRLSDDSAEKCMARAADWARHCQNDGDKPVTMTYVSSSGDTTGTFPGSLGGCSFKITECPNRKDRAGNAAYFPTWNPNDSDNDEEKCLAYARNFYEDCRNPYLATPVEATFVKTGKKQSWPSKEGGGCLIEIPDKCEQHAGKTLVENRDEASCNRRSRDWFNYCWDAKTNSVGKSGNVWGGNKAPVAVTSTYLPSAFAATYPGNQGGCVIDTRGKCPRDNGKWDGFIVETTDEVRCVNNRGRDWWRHCGSDEGKAVSVSFGYGPWNKYPGPKLELSVDADGITVLMAPAAAVATTVTCTADNGAAVSGGPITIPANSEEGKKVAVTGGEVKAWTLTCRTDTGLVDSVINGVENAGRDCWGGCKSVQGKCAWCGTLGICCRKGYADKSGGCDGEMGITGRGHVCVPDTNAA